jgi:MerR family transcriptional regulator, light-induced transcriptional regulator
MTTVRTNAAAVMLGVSPNTLRSWERRFGFPSPRRTAGGHRQFDLRELEALRQAFEQTHNVSSAVRLARERGPGPPSSRRLRGALTRFDEAEADRILEESLTVRSVERTVAEVLLPGVELVAARAGEPPTPEHGFAWRWASAWMAAGRRIAPPATREDTALVLDLSSRPDVDALHAQALELLLRRAGVHALCLPVDFDAGRLPAALAALAPRAVVLAGGHASLDTLGRLVYGARRAGAGTGIFTFRGALPGTGASGVGRLDGGVLAARDAVIAHLDGGGDLADERHGRVSRVRSRA